MIEKELNEEKRWLKKWLILYRCTISGLLRLKILEEIFATKKRIKFLETRRVKWK